ncbi:MAG TPA: amidohydrolase [Burkholderiaceae bacterium]|nr:amidohydrolase [Burkholderiaceae bacterium]
MNRIFKRAGLALFAAVAGAALIGLASCGDGVPSSPATLVLRGGKVLTMDANRTVATAVAVYGNRIVAVGDDASVASYIGPDTRVVELAGRSVVPGFIDAHIHPVLGAERLGQCSMDGETLTIAQILPRIQACVDAEVNPAPDKWIQVVNVNPANFVATANDLDTISTTRPILMSGIDGHTAWVNHKALSLAGITKATPDPAGGQIERDASGNPTGFLKDAAQGLVGAIVPPLSLSERMALTEQALDLARARGITTVQDAWASEDVMEVYAALADAGKLKMRVRATLASDVVDSEAEYQRLIGLRERFARHPLIRANAVKIFSDGVIEYPTQTAAMLYPYLDGHGNATTNYGERYFEQDVLNAYVTRLDAEGFTINVHSIGDFTTRAVLDAFQVAMGQNGVTDNRHQISHLQVIDPAEFPRFAELGVIANMQLFWALPDVYTIEALQPYMLPERHKLLYPAGSLVRAGAMLAGGSDWPVDVFPWDPMPNTFFTAAYMGITRTNPIPDDPQFGQVLNAAEVVTLDDMLAAYTINGAYATRMEAKLGSIEVGKIADLLVIDQDMTTIAPEGLLSAYVQMTFLDGALVEEAPVAMAAPGAALRSVTAMSAGGGVKQKMRRSHDFCAHAAHGPKGAAHVARAAAASPDH